MRRTVFVVPAALVPVIQAACTDQIAERLRRQLTQVVREAGIAPDAATWLKEVGEATVCALAARGSATGAELAASEPRLRTQILAAADNPYGGAVNLTNRLLTVLSAEGLIVRGRPRGGWTSTQFAWSVAPDQADLTAADARAELARRWLLAFGPALVSDLQWWTGWTARQVKQVLGQLEVMEVDLGGAPGTCSPPTSLSPRRCTTRARGQRCCPPLTPPRWAGANGAGTLAGTRRPCSTGQGTSAQRPGGTAGLSAAGGSARTARSPSGCSRTSAPRPRRQ